MGAAHPVLLHGGIDGEVFHLAMPQHRHGAGQLVGTQAGLSLVALKIAHQLHHVDSRRVETLLVRGGIIRLAHHVDAANMDKGGNGYIALKLLARAESQQYQQRHHADAKTIFLKNHTNK